MFLLFRGLVWKQVQVFKYIGYVVNKIGRNDADIESIIMQGRKVVGVIRTIRAIALAKWV